ncbi:MAG: HpcH/HpaI aldolase/citrate lyase family protein [Opitutaceae bacterium]
MNSQNNQETRGSLRSAMFVPGFTRKFLDKAVSFRADALLLDLEDSVPVPCKDDARKYIREYLDQNKFPQQTFIRVNDIESGLLTQDLDATIHENTTGFMFTKVRDENDIIYFDKLLTQYEHDHGFPVGKFKMLPLIEMGSAILRAYQIATASTRMIGLAFGGEDYLTDLDGLHKEHGTSLIVPRSLIVIAARSAHIDVLDTPFLDIRNPEGFRREVEQARELGFSGQLLLHPTQIDVANEIFSPSEEDISEAKRIMAAIRESSEKGQGTTLLDGKLVGPPMWKRAAKVLAKAERIALAQRNHTD